MIGGSALAYKVGLSAIWMDVGGFLAVLALAFIADKIRNFEGYTTPDILGVRFNCYLHKVKIPESIRGEKGVQENLTFTYDSVETENKNKEVLEHQLVTIS